MTNFIVFLQILGIIIPTVCLIILFVVARSEVAEGRGKESAPSWMLIVMALLVFIIGFTLGTIVMTLT